MAKTPKHGSWLERLETKLLTVYGPAQLSPVGKRSAPSAERTDGVSGAWVVRHDATGTSYLETESMVAALPRPAVPLKGQ